MCHPAIMEFCDKCGEWAGPSGPTPEDLEAYKRTLLTFAQAADLVKGNIDEDTLRLLVRYGYVPTAPVASGYFNPVTITQLQARLKNPEVVEKLREWAEWKKLFRRA